MSYTSTYELYKTKVKRISEHKNSHGSGPAIWDYISMKLRGTKFNIFDDKDFWPLYKDNRLTRDELAVLLSTYDNSYVESSHLGEFAKSCRNLHDLIISNTQWQWNHFEAIAQDAENLAAKHDHRCLGLAIGCTSVCDPWEQDEVKNIEAWGIYYLIDELKKQAA